MTDEVFFKRFNFLKRLGWLALIGLVVILIMVIIGDTKDKLNITMLVIAVFLIIPAIFYVCILTIWHWKSRYKGNHSDLWGGLLIFETSGWFKLVYLFRHLVPDFDGTGRYARPDSENGA